MSRRDGKTLLVACCLNVPSMLWFKNAMAALYLKLILSLGRRRKPTMTALTGRKGLAGRRVMSPNGSRICLFTYPGARLGDHRSIFMYFNHTPALIKSPSPSQEQTLKPSINAVKPMSTDCYRCRSSTLYSVPTFLCFSPFFKQVI